MIYSENNRKNLKNKKQNTPDLSVMIYGKVPPQAKELEEAVLGAIMLEKGAFDQAIEFIGPEMFYVDSHQRIFKAFQSLSNRSQPIDIMTTIEELRASEELDLVGGPYYVTKLTNSVVSSANIQAHAQIIHEMYLKREQIRICGDCIKEAYEDNTDAFDVLNTVSSKLTDLSIKRTARLITPISSAIITSVQRIEDLRTKKEDITGVPSGYIDIDRVTFGFQNTDLIILAARPSVGKTAFALNLARNAALNHIKPTPVAFFSLEMSTGQLVNRIMAAESEIWLDRINRGKLEEWDMKSLYIKAIQPLSDAPIYIDDTPALNIFELRAKARRLKNANNIGMIIIDYLQLMSGSGENRNANREQIISEISRNLKALAKELNIPIIALSQLSREIEKRSDPRPQLSDLRESGAIEQDADMVIFGWREDYGKTDDEKDPLLSGVITWRIAKHRNGALEEIPMRCDLAIQKFFTVEQFEDYQKRKSGFRPMSEVVNGTVAKLFIQQGSKQDDEEYF